MVVPDIVEDFVEILVGINKINFTHKLKILYTTPQIRGVFYLLSVDFF